MSKSPSKNMSASLRGQSPMANGADKISVGKVTPATSASMTIPGEGGVENPPGTVKPRSAKQYAEVTAKHFGG